MSEIVTPSQVHVSDQQMFQRCRRKWDLQSRTRRNLEPKEGSASALWFGSAFHFVMEDFHGYKRWPSMLDAYYAYKKCFKPEKLPDDIAELDQLAEGMFTHYNHWLTQRTETLRTLWVDGVPQVEVLWKIPSNLRKEDGSPIYYEGKFDRVVVDANDQFWILDYKTAKTFNSSKNDLDSQISRYTWAGNILYPKYKFAGCIWQTHKKEVPYEPEELKRGGLSVNKQQNTTHFLYRRALAKMYGPGPYDTKYVEMLDHLLEIETPDSDKFIRRDFVFRNEHQIRNHARHGENIIIDMLDPNLSIYPNPTRDCTWDCDFYNVCLQMDDGSNWQEELKNNFQTRPPENSYDEWRQRLVYPTTT